MLALFSTSLVNSRRSQIGRELPAGSAMGGTASRSAGETPKGRAPDCLRILLGSKLPGASPCHRSANSPPNRDLKVHVPNTAWAPRPSNVYCLHCSRAICTFLADSGCRHPEQASCARKPRSPALIDHVDVGRVYDSHDDRIWVEPFRGEEVLVALGAESGWELAQQPVANQFL